MAGVREAGVMLAVAVGCVSVQLPALVPLSARPETVTCLAGADALVAERAGGGGGIQRHVVAADHAHQGGAGHIECRCSRAVIDLIVAPSRRQPTR